MPELPLPPEFCTVQSCVHGDRSHMSMEGEPSPVYENKNKMALYVAMLIKTVILTVQSAQGEGTRRVGLIGFWDIYRISVCRCKHPQCGSEAQKMMLRNMNRWI